MENKLGLTCKATQEGDRSRAGLIYQWIIWSPSKPENCVVVAMDFPKGMRLDCLHGRESEEKRKADRGEDRETERFAERRGVHGEREGKWSPKQHHRVSWPSTL